MRHPRLGGPLRLAALLSLALLALPLPTAMAGILEDLRGDWAAEPSGPPTMEWASTSDGFSVSWAPPGAAATTVHFAPSGRAGVYAGEAKVGWSVMDSMFGNDGPVDPLAGEALFWARIAAETVHMYKLVIDDQGGLELDHYACRLDNGALAVSLQRRTAAGMADPIDQLLVRAAK